MTGIVDRVLGSTTVVPESVKVPLRITVLFWVTKLVSTAMGESLADWLDGNRNLFIAGVGGLIAFIAFLLALRWQFSTTRYNAAAYWFAVAMVATFGTMVADALHQFLAAPFWATTLFYALILALVFWRWRLVEGTLSIHSIATRRREKFYWSAVLATFALGTAAGDWTGDSLGLHYLPSAALFAGLIAVPAIGFAAGANGVAMFWFAYVLTRPLGASLADWMDFSKLRHGLGISHPLVWGPLAALLIVLVALLSIAARRRRESGEADTALITESVQRDTALSARPRSSVLESRRDGRRTTLEES